MNGPVEIKAIQIGGLAIRALGTGIPGKVMGITSSGIFLNTADKILFLTSADYRSPYNIQIGSIDSIASTINVGDPCFTEGEGLFLGDRKFRIDIGTAKIWQPQPLVSIETDRKAQLERMKTLIHRLYELDPNKGWVFLSAQEAVNRVGQNHEAFRIRQITDSYIESVRLSDKTGCLASARSILGLGGGLTPSGDDWLTGFFLFHARKGKAQQLQDPFMLDLGTTITTLAFERTTKISANRIVAACQGWAEELFLEVIDHLFVTGKLISDEKTAHLVNFGHSSGVDTCMGIWAALMAQK